MSQVLPAQDQVAAPRATASYTYLGKRFEQNDVNYHLQYASTYFTRCLKLRKVVHFKLIIESFKNHVIFHLRFHHAFVNLFSC